MRILLFILFVFNGILVEAKIILPSVISDNMVLQQQTEITIWGRTTHLIEKIELTPSWNNQVYTTTAHQGIWSVKLITPKAGGPYKLIIKGHETIVLKNILIGEVWMCSGQSNMAWRASSKIDDADKEISSAIYPAIRFFSVLQTQSIHPQEDVVGEWVECSPQTMKDFSAVSFFFGREIYKETRVPVGLINASWGGTPIEPWIPSDLINSDNELVNALYKLNKSNSWPIEPGVTYNGMIYPFTKFSIAGTIWYQGESNVPAPFAYRKSFTKLIRAWRSAWNNDFPFYYVQIAPFKYNGQNVRAAAVLRESQQMALELPKTGMAVINDVGDTNCIHPSNKQVVGKRLALLALAKVYGKSDLVFSGPQYRSMLVEGNNCIISFDYVRESLMSDEEEVSCFEIAGENRVFYPAKAKIFGKTVHVHSKHVKNPVAVRFAFTNAATPGIYNQAGLPASAFRTDNWDVDLHSTTDNY